MSRVQSMYCLKCGIQIPPESVFCFKCGTHMPSVNPQDRVQEEPVEPRKLSRIIWATVLAVIVGGLIVSGLIIEAKRRQVRETVGSGQALQAIAEPSSAPTAAPSPTPYWAPDSRKVGSESLSIPPGQFYSFPFEVESGWRNA